MILKALLLFPVFIFSLSAQTSYVAETGGDKITSEEFKMRYEMMPVISTANNIDTMKHELLYTLVAEKLLAKEADALGYDEGENYKDIYNSLEKMFVRDALFKEAVVSKINITQNEILHGMERVNHELKTNIISSPDSSEIYEVYTQLQSGARFDSLLMLRPEYRDQHEPYPIRYGDIQQDYVEDALFSLVPGKYSEPVKTRDGWFIFYLNNMSIIDEKGDAAALESRVKKLLDEKKRVITGAVFMQSLLQNVEAIPDTLMFMKLAEKIAAKLAPSDTILHKTEKDFIVLSEKDLIDIKAELGKDTLNMIFIPLGDTPVTVNDFLNRYYHYDFTTRSSEMPYVIGSLRKDLFTFIEDEILTREGYKRGLDKLPQVQADLKMWKDSYLAHLYKNSFFSSADVRDEEVIEYYNALYQVNQPVTQVNIIEIASNDLSVIEYALDQVNEGEDFKQVSEKVSETFGKESGFFPITQRGEIGRIAGGLNIGDVYGPLQTETGYTLFKLIDKKEAELNLPETYDQVKETLKNQLKVKKMNASLTAKVVELSNKYPVVINDRVLASLKTTSVKMFGLRNMGFGGRIFAVPYSPPFHEWIKEAGNVKRILP